MSKLHVVYLLYIIWKYLFFIFGLSRDLSGLLNRPLDDPSTDHVFLQQLVSGYQLLHSVGLLSKVSMATTLPDLANKLLDYVHSVRM